MKTRVTCAAAALMVAIAALSPRARAQNQAPTDLSGTWTLDTYLSDSPEQVAAAVRLDLGLGPVNRGGDTTEHGRGDQHGGGRGRGGTYGRQGAPRQDLTPEEQARLD